MNRRLLLTILLLPLIGCESTGAPPVEPLADEQPYQLQIAFHGLIAFTEDSGKVWAFLVNAAYDKEQLSPEVLPPGVFEEVTADPSWLEEYPPHFAQIRFRNARIVEGSVPDPRIGISIAGKDLRFETSVQTLSSVYLGELSDAAKIFAARPDLTAEQREQISKLDQLDPVLVEEGLDPRLAARALIEAGSVLAQPIDDCDPEFPRFSFKVPTDDYLFCPGEVEDAQKLAEEVIVTQTGVSGSTVIHLGDERIAIKPEDLGKPMIIEVVNEIQEAINDPDLLPCDSRHDHLAAFRWFYRLLPEDQQGDTTGHFFPCWMRGVFGDPKCPQKVFGGG